MTDKEKPAVANMMLYNMNDDMDRYRGGSRRKFPGVSRCSLPCYTVHLNSALSSLYIEGYPSKESTTILS